MGVQIDFDRQKVAAFCGKWQIKELSLFGSVLREEFREDSDVDVLIDFAEDSHWSLLDMVEMQDELRQILGREVDLVSRRGVEMSKNPLRREAILSSAEVIHGT